MRCKHIKTDSERCKAETQTDSDWCWFHDPEKKTHRHEAQARGGKTDLRGLPAPTDAEPLPLETASDIKRALGIVVNETRRRTLDYRIANSCILGLSALLKALDQVDIEAELAALRGEIETLKGVRATA